MINKFITFLKENGFQDINGRMVKHYTGTASGRPMVKIYAFNGDKVTKRAEYADTGEKYKSKSFNVKNVVYTPSGKYLINKPISYKAMEREAMESIGLVRCIGPVSGKVYWE
jgi:hypothetical protein